MWSLVSTLLSLRNADPQRRQSAAKKAGSLPYKAAIRALIRTLGDTKNDVRVAAIVALSESGNVHAVPLLSRALKNMSSSIRLGAANVLGIRASAMDRERAAAFDALVEAFHVEADAQAVMAMAMSMRNTGDPRAVDRLIGALDHRFVNQCTAAATALMTVHEPRVFEALAKTFEKTNMGALIEVIAKALASFDDVRAVGLLITKLKTMETVYVLRNGETYYYERPGMQMTPVFMTAVAAIRDPGKTAFLIRGLDDPDQPVRVFCAMALGETGDSAAEASLLELSARGDEGDRAAAKEGLKSLRTHPRPAP